VIEIVRRLRQLKDLLENLISLAHHHAFRHALGGADEVHIDASQIVSGEFSMDLVPSEDNTYDIGIETKRWKDGHFTGTVYAKEFEGESLVIIFPL